MSTFLLNLLFGFIAKFIGAFAAKLSAAIADNPSLMDAAVHIVAYAKTHIDDDEEKRHYEIEYLKAYAKELGKDLSTSGADALILAALSTIQGYGK